MESYICAQGGKFVIYSWITCTVRTLKKKRRDATELHVFTKLKKKIKGN